VLHTYTWKLVYAVLSLRDAQYQTCLQQVLIKEQYLELKGPIKVKEPTAVKGPTERKLKFFSYSRMAVGII